MELGRYLNTAKEIIQWVADWIGLAIDFWREIVAVAVIMWVSWKAMDLLIAWTSRRSIIAIVTHKERVYYPRSLKSMYLIYTDQGVFRNQDSWAFLSFDSSDVYSKIEVGSTYKFIVYGYRNRWGSEYPNVLRVEIS